MTKILLLAGNTIRARAYAQMLSQLNEKIEVFGLFYGFSERTYSPPPIDQVTDSFLRKNNFYVPNLNEDLSFLFDKMNWRYEYIESSDVNSSEVLFEISRIESEIIIFCGYGGQLLKPIHFTNNRKYLHFHPGELPLERGSTTVYYSILNKRDCSVSGFYMSEKIDDGENIICCKYPVPKKGVNIDLWYDNIIRADCLRRTIPIIINKKSYLNFKNEISEEYYVIHPVLKHLALLSLK